jgi:hypothetical protein
MFLLFGAYLFLACPRQIGSVVFDPVCSLGLGTYQFDQHHVLGGTPQAL